MMLGQLLRSLPEASDDEIVAGFTGDLVRLARIQAAAAAREQSLGIYIRDAIRRFLDTTSEEEWTTAMRSEEHTSELQSLMRNSYAVFCLKKKTYSRPTD